MLYTGTSGWAYPAWKPVFYPEKLPQKKFLQHYARRLNAVEVNYTFRHLASEKTLLGWMNDTPDHFKFSLKAHQAITHIKRLRNAEEMTMRFLSSIQPLAASGRLGPVLFQLPPTMKADVALLDEFLASLPRSLRVAFEFRHESWFAEAVTATLGKHNAALCVAESDDLITPEVATADFIYYRFRKSDYPPQVRQELAKRIEFHMRTTPGVFAYFKHEEHPESPLWAEEVLNAVQDEQARRTA